MPEGPGWWVMRFGGTCAATSDGWRTIAKAIEEARRHGARPVIVCPAPEGLPEDLEELLDRIAAGAFADRPERATEIVGDVRSRHRDLAREAGVGIGPDARLESVLEELGKDLLGASLRGEVSPRMRARAMAAGELAATAVGARILEALLPSDTPPVRWHDARTLLETTGEGPAERRYLLATCPPGQDRRVAARLSEAGPAIHITQGSIAGTPDGETALLGRGGPDVSAALLAERLAADRLEIWSDMPGFFTADPRLVPSARLLRHLGYAEGQELASTGARVLHPRAVEIARRAGLMLHLRFTMRPEVEGTVLSAHAPDPGEGVLALAVRRDVTLVSMETAGMWQQVGFLADVFAVFARHGLSIDLVSTSETNVSVTLDPVANALDPEVLRQVMVDLARYCEPRLATDLSAVSLVGRGLRTVLSELVPAVEALHGQAVHLLSQAASDLNLSAVVETEQVDRIVRELHAGFFGAAVEGKILGPTWDRIMGQTPADGPTQSPWWLERREELLDLAARGTPRYVYDLPSVRRAAAALRDLPAIDRVLYAVKANDHPAILEAVRAAGLGFECVSLGEVEHVLDQLPGAVAGDVLFTPNFAPREEYARALELGVTVTVDNLYVLEAWPQLFGGREIFLRIDPGQGRGHHRGVRTAGPGSKFGVAPDLLPRVRALADAAGARVVGLHAHLGSGITDPLAWAETAATLSGYGDRFPDVRVLDLGGGLAAPGLGAGFDVEAASNHLDAFKAVHPHLELWLEPGRYVVAEAGVLLARVTQLKAKGESRFAGVDAGMHTLIRPALYGAYHEIVNLSRIDDEPDRPVEVVGPICETADVLGHARRLAGTREGDILLVATAGAYGRVMASNYNRRGMPGESVLD